MGLFSATKKDTQVGVEFLTAGVAVVQVQATKKSPGKILRSDYLPAAGCQGHVGCSYRTGMGYLSGYKQ